MEKVLQPFLYGPGVVGIGGQALGERRPVPQYAAGRLMPAASAAINSCCTRSYRLGSTDLASRGDHTASTATEEDLSEAAGRYLSEPVVVHS